MQINILKLSVLYIIAILFVTTNLNNVHYLGSSYFLPLFEVMIIYYFAVYQNNIFGSWILFLLGIWSDALNGLPIGITSLIYLIVVKLFNFIRQKQAIKENFASILQEFAIFISIILLLKWMLLSIYNKNFYNITSYIIQIIVSCIAYVLIHKICDFLFKKLSKDY